MTSSFDIRNLTKLENMNELYDDRDINRLIVKAKYKNEDVIIKIFSDVDKNKGYVYEMGVNDYIHSMQTNKKIQSLNLCLKDHFLFGHEEVAFKIPLRKFIIYYILQRPESKIKDFKN